MMLKTFLVFFVIMSFALTVYSQDSRVLFKEDFSDLVKWQEVFFPKIEKHTTYSIEKQGDDTYLKAQSESAASLLVYIEPFDVYTFPRVRWRWKIDGIIATGNAKTKDGDDYPIRIYIAFEYDPDTSGFFERAQYSAIKALYGQYPPHSSLNYIWANKEHAEDILSSVYTGRSIMILLQKGAARAGTWVREDINIIEDYEKAFGEKPPGRATIGIMADSDNTGESATSYIDYIMV
ncbi:MAG: DUF3047 domain-containing protein, partial [Deltaproteobacteria bacterium]|nr:DUF3047 domain-containing protein [Deltaproteobacteria bacterium]